MKNINLFTILFCTLFIVACGSDDDTVSEQTSNLNINFTGSFDSDPLQMQKEYNFCDGRLVKFTQFNFYVSEIVLLRNNDPETPVTELKDIDFVELSFTNEADAITGQTISIPNVPVGDYSGIRIGLGVAADLNRTKPEEYGSSSPLSTSSHYWEGWNSYIFAKLDGFADLDNDGTITQGGAGSEGVSYHTGSDDVYVESTMFKDINLEEGVEGTIQLNFDISTAFDMVDPVYDTNSDGCLDIETFNGTHTDASLEIADQIMDNLSNNITVEF